LTARNKSLHSESGAAILILERAGRWVFEQLTGGAQNKCARKEEKLFYAQKNASWREGALILTALNLPGDHPSALSII
jgi:hypothetical protein